MLAESDMQSVFVGLRTPNSGVRVACRRPSAARCLFGAPRTAPRLLLTGLALALLSACQPEADTAPPQVRPVRTVTVVKREVGETVSYTGRIQAENETRLSFRISGRMVERSVNVGDHVEPEQVVAKLEPQDELNALRTAQASVAAAQGQLNQAQSNFDRQQTLLARDIASRAQFEQAESALKTARAQLDTAEAVQAGQMVIRVARKDGRDAVFDVPAQLLRSAPSDPLISVSLSDDLAVTAIGRVREVSPQADPVTRTFEVKVGLTDPPAAMRLGATVVGRMKLDTAPVIEIPATALTEFDRRPAVWGVDPSSLTVSLRNVEVARNDPATIAISQGLDSGEIVVTAGTQALHPGQKTRLLESAR